VRTRRPPRRLFTRAEAAAALAATPAPPNDTPPPLPPPPPPPPPPPLSLPLSASPREAAALLNDCCSLLDSLQRHGRCLASPRSETEAVRETT